MPVGVIVALEREAHTLGLQRIVMGEVVKIDGVLVCVSGMGAKCAENAAQKLIEHGANALVSWGCAGSLVEGLNAGDLLVPARVRGTDGVDNMVDEAWRSKVLHALSTAPDDRTIAESPELLSDVAAKHQLAITSNAVAVDMESAAVLRIANRHSVPGLVLRAVADTCHDRLPKSLEGALNPIGGLRILRFTAKLLRHPSDILALCALNSKFRRASATLRRTKSVLGKQFSFVE